jgi:hypothetical protein
LLIARFTVCDHIFTFLEQILVFTGYRTQDGVVFIFKIVGVVFAFVGDFFSGVDPLSGCEQNTQ